MALRPTPPTTPHPARHPHPPTGHPRPSATPGQATGGANYTVWLVELASFPNDQTRPTDPESQAALIRRGVSERLQELFDLVARRVGGVRIGLRWVTDLAQLRPAAREVVVYFTNSFQTGLIRPLLLQCTGQSPTTGVPTAGQQAGCTTALNQFQPPPGQRAPEDGLTFHTDAQMGPTRWALSEVYVGDIIRHDFPTLANRHPNLANWADQWRLMVGRQIAHTVFHEVMHNKIEPAHPRTWDMHTQGGGGLAASGGFRVSETTQNIALLAGQLLRTNPRQYVHNTDRLVFPPPPPPRPPRRGRAAAPAADPWAGLGGV